MYTTENCCNHFVASIARLACNLIISFSSLKETRFNILNLNKSTTTTKKGGKIRSKNFFYFYVKILNI